MSSKSIGFFLVPVAHVDELLALHAYRRDALFGEEWEDTARENQLYRRARELSIFRVERVTDEDLSNPLLAVLSEVDHRAWHDHPDVIVPEECPDRLRALDAFEEHRGGRDRVIQYLAGQRGFRQTEKAIREVYSILRSMLERAHREHAALAWASLYPGAEEKAAAERQRMQKIQAELDELERQGKLHDPLPLDELDVTYCREEAAMLAMQAKDPPKGPDPEYWPREYPGLAVLPARCVEAVQAVYREAEDIYQTTGNISASFEKSQKGDDLLMREAHDEEYFWCLGERGAWDVIAAEALGLEPRIRPPKDHGVRRMMFTVEETRAMADALERWSDALGGRDAAIEHMVSRAYAPSRAMCERVYDAATRLLYTARARSAVLAIIQCISD